MAGTARKKTVTKKPDNETSSDAENVEGTEAPAFVPRIKKAVTMPTLKLLEGSTVYVKITEPIFPGKERPPKDGEDPKKPPMIFNVLNLAENNRPMQLIANKVLESEITEENYPDQAYVGLCFMITKGAMKGSGDRKYATYEIFEIDDPTGDA